MDSTVLNTNNNTDHSSIYPSNSTVDTKNNTVRVPATIATTYATSVDNNNNINNTVETDQQIHNTNHHQHRHLHDEYVPLSESKICFTRQEIIRWFFNTWLIVMVVIVIIFFISYRYSLQFDRIGNLIQYGYLRGPEGDRGPQGKDGKRGPKGQDGMTDEAGNRSVPMGVSRAQFLPEHIDPVKWEKKMKAWDRYHEKLKEQGG
jgi:hypothetical protein